MQDDGSYPVPPDCTQITEFKTKDFTGKWYITAGLNPLFDTFDCQVRCGTNLLLVSLNHTRVESSFGIGPLQLTKSSLP